MKIIKYEDKYRDDMIFMILEAKNALGRVPGLNEDLLNIKKNYLDVGDMFWLAIDEQDRVIGSIGYNSIRDTYEVPGGHRESGEDILATAKRELLEETGATDFTIKPICAYSVKGQTNVMENINDETFGMLFFAEVFSFQEIHSEIEKNLITDNLVENWTYPLIQPQLIEEAKNRGYL